jgi:hypothetical protein
MLHAASAAGRTDSVVASASTTAFPATTRATNAAAPAKSRPMPHARSASRRQPLAR